MVAWGAGGPLFVGECLGLGLIRASWVSGLGGDCRWSPFELYVHVALGRVLGT